LSKRAIKSGYHVGALMQSRRYLIDKKTPRNQHGVITHPRLSKRFLILTFCCASINNAITRCIYIYKLFVWPHDRVMQRSIYWKCKYDGNYTKPPNPETTISGLGLQCVSHLMDGQAPLSRSRSRPSDGGCIKITCKRDYDAHSSADRRLHAFTWNQIFLESDGSRLHVAQKCRINMNSLLAMKWVYSARRSGCWVVKVVLATTVIGCSTSETHTNINTFAYADVHSMSWAV